MDNTTIKTLNWKFNPVSDRIQWKDLHNLMKKSNQSRKEEEKVLNFPLIVLCRSLVEDLGEDTVSKMAG